MLHTDEQYISQKWKKKGGGGYTNEIFITESVYLISKKKNRFQNLS